jgi:hypothetical protein
VKFADMCHMREVRWMWPYASIPWGADKRGSGWARGACRGRLG